MIKRPLLCVALGYAGGILMAGLYRPPLPVLFGAGLLLALAGLFAGRFRSWLLWALVIVCGWTNLAWREAVLSPFDLRVLLGEAPEILQVRGRLRSTPTPRVFKTGDQERVRSMAELEVLALRRHGSNPWERAVGRVVVTTSGEPPAGFFGGDEVEVEGVLDRPPGAKAEGLFDYRSYLQNQGIYYQLRVSGTNDWLRISPLGAVPVADRFLKWAETTLARGLPGVDEELRLLWSMTLGYRGIPQEYYQPFIRSGTMHIFAISGMHIALIAAILAALLECARIPRRWCGAIIIPLIWFYTMATGWQPSAVRSVVMMTIILAGWVLVRPNDLLNSLCAAALVILVWEPREFFGASFQLSFVVVLSLALLASPLTQGLASFTAEEPLLPNALQPWWRRALRGPLRWFWLSVATSIAAFVGSWPLISHYFHLLSPVTLVANLVIIPLSSAALACNLGSLVCGSWLPPLTELFNASAWLWMRCMVRLSDWSTLPGWACWNMPAMDWLDIAVYYGLVTGLMLIWAWRVQNRRGPLVKWLGLALLVAVPLGMGVCGWRWVTALGTTELTILPFDGGLTIVCDRPGWTQDWLIDTGTAKSAGSITVPFLQAQGRNALPKLLLTHGDAAHAGGAAALMDTFGPAKIFVSATRFRSPIYRRAVERAATVEKSAEPGRSLPPWTILYPVPGRSFPKADDNSVVLKAEFKGTRVLIVPDLGSEGQTALLDSGVDLSADLVIASPPAGAEPLQEEVLSAIRPKAIILCDGESGGPQQARPALRKRLDRQARAVYTSEAGALKLSLDGSRWWLESFDGKSRTHVPMKSAGGRFVPAD